MKTFYTLIALLIGVTNYAQQYYGLDPTFGTNGLVSSTSTLRPIALDVFFENDQYFFITQMGYHTRNYDGTPGTAVGGYGWVPNGQTTYSYKRANEYLYFCGRLNGANSQYKGFIYRISLNGILDTSFGTNGELIIDFPQRNEIITDIVVNADGSLFAYGTLTSGTPVTNSLFISKINPNGTLNLDFSPSGFKSFNYNTNTESANIFEYEGGLLLLGTNGGNGSVGNPGIYTSTAILSKIDYNGNPMADFGINGVKELYIGDITNNPRVLSGKLSNNKLYLNTRLTNFLSQSYYYNFIKYDLASFNQTYNIPTYASTFKVDNEENLYLSRGGYTCFGCVNINRLEIQKRDALGQLDLNFNGTGIYRHEPLYGSMATAFYLHDDGKILLTGYYQYGSGDSPYERTIRLGDSALGNASFTNAKFSLYPNPTNDILNIIPSDNTNIEKITVTDLFGKNIIEQKGNIKSLDVNHLENGVYIISIYAEHNKSSVKFIKS